MKRAKSICNRPGCGALLDAPGYCNEHKTATKEYFQPLDDKKSPEEKRFYSSRAWTNASKRQREIEPLCRPCYARGKVVKADLTHHNPSLKALWAQNLDPLDPQYHESLCTSCHLGELRAKKGTDRPALRLLESLFDQA